MTKNPFKLEKTTKLPFFGSVEKGDSLFTTIPFLKNFIYFGNWKFSFFKPSVFFSNYRIRAKTSITTNCKRLNNIQFIIALFPFLFSFSLLIRSRYKDQIFSYLVKDKLPGFCLPHQNISWQTFREITSKKMASLSDDKLYISKPPNIIKGLQIKDLSVQTLKDNAQMLERDFSIRKFNSVVSQTENQEKQTNLVSLQNQDFIKRLDIYSNLILLEMKPAWEPLQKQLYIGFLPKAILNKLPVFFYGKQNKGDVAEKAFVRISNKNNAVSLARDTWTSFVFVSTKKLMPLQRKNNTSKGYDKFSEYKFYARNPNFLSLYKDKIDLKSTLINKKPNLINVFSKQPFQQKLFDLDELPLKLDQNYSEVLPSKKEENQNYLTIPGPNLFKAFQTFPNHKFLSDLLHFSFTEKRNISNVENVITNRRFNSNLVNLSSEVKENTNETFNKPLLYQSDVKEETFSKKNFLENELKNNFYNEGFIPFKNLQKYTDQFVYLDLPSSFTNKRRDTSEASRRFANFVSDFSNEEKNINDVKEFDFFDSIQSLILNLEKKHINLTLPKQGFITQLKLLSGYKYPDMEIAKLRSLLIQSVYKNIVFQKLNKESLPIKIEVPSSFVYDFLNESNSLTSTSWLFKKEEGPGISWDEVFVSLLKEKKPIFSIPSFVKKEGIRQLKFHYLPASQTLLNQKLSEKSNVGGIYQKVLTIYKGDRTIKNSLTTNPDRKLLLVKDNTNNFSVSPSEINISSNKLKPIKNFLLFLKPFLYSQKPFRESWEPVTVQSWLATTKLSFVFIALKIFQSLLLNYGKELVFLGFLDDNLKDEFGLTDKKKDKGYRLIKKVKKRFKDVAGIDNILPELGEMVWVLRNSGPSFKVGNVLPKGFLFVGPPGTGKTLLVQAIAGEAEVPVLVQSGSSLTDAEENEKGAQRLKNLFEEARKVAPCIVFIDEIDTLGESRQNVMRNPVGTDDLIQSLHKSNQELNENSSDSSGNNGKLGNITEKQNRGGVTRSKNFEHTSYSSIGKKNQAKQQANQEQLNLLMQFLVELDGLKSRTGVIVIGATNRPKVLDPALTRPGRFDRVLNLEFPGKRKRIEILKLYSQNIGVTFSSTTFSDKVQVKALLPDFPSTNEKKQINFSVANNLGKNGDRNNVLKNENEVGISSQASKNKGGPRYGVFASLKRKSMVAQKKLRATIVSRRETMDLDLSWEYLANRTFGFSAADLAAAMNQSSIQAILRNTGHTIETIEQGIEFITSYSLFRPKTDIQKEKDPFFITRFAYYQAGKAVLHTLLPQHPDAIILKLWPQPKNSRHKKADLPLTSINHRANLETRLIGLYAGKAAELLFLCLNSHTKKQNTNKKKTNDKFKEKALTNRKSVSVGNTLRKGYASSTSDITFGDVKAKRKQVSNVSQYDKRNLWHSSLGIEDLSVASHLAYSLVDKWHFYSNKVAIRRENQIFTNQNQIETSEIKVFDLFQQLTEDMQNRVSASNISESNVLLNSSSLIGRDKHSRYNFQELSVRPWWQNQITKQTGASPYKNDVFVRNLNMFYDDWYRIYLPDPEESERNEEWVTPDEYYHNTQNLKNLLPIASFHFFNKKNKCNSYLLPTFKNLTNPRFLAGFISPLDEKSLKEKNNVRKDKNKVASLYKGGSRHDVFVKDLIFKNGQTKNKLYFDITWNDLYKLDRDYIYHALILTSFNQAFSLLDDNRELLDYLADYLMRFETLRQQKIKEIFYDFGSPKIEKKSFLKNKQTVTKTPFLSLVTNKEPTFVTDQLKILKDKQKINFIFDKKWGKNSRRNFSRFFSFDQQRPLSKKIYSRPFTFFETINK